MPLRSTQCACAVQAAPRPRPCCPSATRQGTTLAPCTLPDLSCWSAPQQPVLALGACSAGSGSIPAMRSSRSSSGCWLRACGRCTLRSCCPFHVFPSPTQEDTHLHHKPLLLVGRYSADKTTLIQHLMEQDVPGMRMGGAHHCLLHRRHAPPHQGVVPGNALVMRLPRPFYKLNTFSNGVLSRFMGAQCWTAHESLTLLGSCLKRHSASAEVTTWWRPWRNQFAERLDICGEFSEVIKALKDQEDEVRVVLNKAQQIQTEQLMRVSGPSCGPWGRASTLLRGSGCTFTPSGSICSSAPTTASFSRPRSRISSKTSSSCYMLAPSRCPLPSVKRAKGKIWCTTWERPTRRWSRSIISPLVTSQASRHMQELLQTQDFLKFQALKLKLLETMNDMLANDIACLMAMACQEEGRVSDGTVNRPFGHNHCERAGEDIDDVEWVVDKDKTTYNKLFHMLSPVKCKIISASANEMLKSKPPSTVLGKAWKLAMRSRARCWMMRDVPWAATSSKSSWRATGCPQTCPHT
ncbi:hypothetical protein HPG69_003444 [Diceros bicornis minor]|uniref:Uncharacterized protein n=1 Tax=Diceros bicornis minor TaxID=77932 RepID=A0A7J7E8V5_DICBM|nr:hypothetical protein HPG69_003444 [Diceros bicornis minor]